VLIRLEKETDCDDVYGVHVSAFPTPSEAILVNALTPFGQNAGRAKYHAAFEDL
jgi:hypothetical protein